MGRKINEFFLASFDLISYALYQHQRIERNRTSNINARMNMPRSFCVLILLYFLQLIHLKKNVVGIILFLIAIVK